MTESFIAHMKFQFVVLDIILIIMDDHAIGCVDISEKMSHNETLLNYCLICKGYHSKKSLYNCLFIIQVCYYSLPNLTYT